MIKKMVAATILALQCGVVPVGAQGSKVEIDLPDSIKHSKGAPIFADVEQAPPKKVEGWTFRHVFLRVKLSEGRFEYLTYVQGAGRRWFALAGPDKKGVKPLVFMIAKEPGINETALPKLTIKNNRSAFENLKLEMGGMRVFPWYDAAHGPFIFACINLCDPDQARAGLAGYFTPASPPTADASAHAPKQNEAPPHAPKQSDNEQIHVYAYDPEKGTRIDGPQVIVLPACDMTKLKTSSPTPIKASGHPFTLPADPKVRTFCLLIAEYSDPRSYHDYRCDLRPKADPGQVTQAWIAWGPLGRAATSSLPRCSAPPPRTLSVRIYDIPIDIPLESAREQISRGELKPWPPSANLGAFSISDAKPKVEGASLRWDAPYGQEVGREISVTPPNDNYELVGTNVENDDLAVFLRRRSVTFGEVSFRLTDEAGKPEPNCDAVLLIPRKAVSAGKHRPPVKDEVPLYVGADGNYFPSLDLTSARQRTNDARLQFAALGTEITIETRSDNCRLRGERTFRRPKADLLRSPVSLAVTPAQPLLSLVLWPDRNLGKQVPDSAQRDLIWSDLILTALQEATADSKSPRWREIRVVRRDNDNALASMYQGPSDEPIPSNSRTMIVNTMTLGSEPGGSSIFVKFDESFFKRLAESSSESVQPSAPLPQVVLLVGQTLDQIKYCAGAEMSFRFLQEYQRFTIVIVDLITDKQAEQLKPIQQQRSLDVVTCPDQATRNGRAARVQYVAVVVPNVVTGTARLAAAREVLAAQFRMAFDQASPKGQQ
jgi:hypothetical protein